MASTASVFGRTVDEASSAPACLRGSTKPHRSRRKGFQLGQTRKHSSTRAHVHATQSMQVRANASTHGVVTSTTCLYRALRKPELGFCAGLVEVGDQVGKLRAGVLDRRLVQVVLARTSDLLGRRVRDTRFRSRFDAAIIALHREGHRLHQPIGETTLAVRPSAAPPPPSPPKSLRLAASPAMPSDHSTLPRHILACKRRISDSLHHLCIAIPLHCGAIPQMPRLDVLDAVHAVPCFVVSAEPRHSSSVPTPLPCTRAIHADPPEPHRRVCARALPLEAASAA